MASKYTEEQLQRMRQSSQDQGYASSIETSTINEGTAQQSAVQATPRSAQYTEHRPQHQWPQHNKQQTPYFSGTKITNTHILFWHGPLSNWSTEALFSGDRALEILLPRLTAARINHPSERALSTKLLARHHFNCGEQFMMACKGWLFERDQRTEAISETLTDEEMEGLCRTVMGEPEPWSPSPSPPPTTANANANTSPPRAKSRSRSRSRSPNKQPQPQPREPRFPAADLTAIRTSTLVQVLQSSEPRYQKSLGRQTRNFNDRVWTPASKHVVVSACIARAETDSKLLRLYHLAGNAVPQQQNTNTQTRTQSPGTGKKRQSPGRGTNTTTNNYNTNNTTTTEKLTRTFVEGSPVDRIWGVGLKWDDSRCDDERNWRGENRLGKCHDEAAKYIRENGI